MFASPAFMVPGQELREFTVLRRSKRTTGNGRVLTNSENAAPAKVVGTLLAVLAQAKPEEIERWKQQGHPITHKIIQQGPPSFEIKPNDEFERGERRFIHHKLPYDPGDLGLWTIYYCEERSDT